MKVRRGSLPPGWKLTGTRRGTWSLIFPLAESWIDDYGTEVVDTHPTSETSLIPVDGLRAEAAAVVAALTVLHEVAEFSGQLWQPHHGGCAKDKDVWDLMAGDVLVLIRSWSERWPRGGTS
jgi:hypothetical protein